MTIPSKLTIGGHEITVVIQPLEEKCGLYDRTKNTIFISNDLTQSQREATFLHEILHALNSEFSDGMAHIILDSLAEQLYAVLKGNRLSFHEEAS